MTEDSRAKIGARQRVRFKINGLSKLKLDGPILFLT